MDNMFSVLCQIKPKTVNLECIITPLIDINETSSKNESEWSIKNFLCITSDYWYNKNMFIIPNNRA